MKADPSKPHGRWHSPQSTWARAALLAAAVVTAISVPALTYITTASERPVRGLWSQYPTTIAQSGYVVTRLGCVADRSATALDHTFRSRWGPIVGLDNAHVIKLGPQRFLWVFNDTYFDYTNSKTSLADSPSIRNAAVLQTGNCFRLVRRGDQNRILSFEPGDARDVTVEGIDRFFWALGGEVRGRRIQIFWAEMKQDKQPAPSDGIARHPVRTWLATYDARTLERLDFRPAPNDGVFPQYGFAVASDHQYSYLFGNSNLLNFSLEGGFFGRSHSATKMYLARVPRGQLEHAPEYRTADGWSDDAVDATPFSTRFAVENQMQPRFLAGHWIAVTKVDGFAGRDTLLEVADHPWGPWRVVSRRAIEPFRGWELMNNYQPVILPYRRPSGDLLIVMSQNALHWPNAINDSSMYRLHAYSEPWPFQN